MTVKELIELLQDMNPSAKVTAYDSESEQIEEVTGLLWNSDTVELCTDAKDE